MRQSRTAASRSSAVPGGHLMMRLWCFLGPDKRDPHGLPPLHVLLVQGAVPVALLPPEGNRADDGDDDFGGSRLLDLDGPVSFQGQTQEPGLSWS